jgi:hypothetical protein
MIERISNHFSLNRKISEYLFGIGRTTEGAVESIKSLNKKVLTRSSDFFSPSRSSVVRTPDRVVSRSLCVNSERRLRNFKSIEEEKSRNSHPRKPSTVTVYRPLAHPSPRSRIDFQFLRLFALWAPINCQKCLQDDEEGGKRDTEKIIEKEVHDERRFIAPNRL